MARKSRQEEIARQLRGIQKTPKPKSLQVGAYIRISVQDKGEVNSIATQKQIILDYLNHDPELVLYKFYVDNGSSSFDTVRPAFREMANDANNGIINCIIVKDLSRFGRNYMEALPYVEEIFPMYHIHFISILDDYDSRTGSSRDMLLIMLKSLINYQYSVDLSKKIKSVVQMKQSRGDYVPAYFPYGYRKEKSDDKITAVIDEQAAIVVKDIFLMFVEGKTAYQIAGELNQSGILSPMDYRHRKHKLLEKKCYWTDITVNRILKNPFYKGTFVGGKTQNLLIQGNKLQVNPLEEYILIENHHTAIVSSELFQKAQGYFNKDHISTVRNTESVPEKSPEEFWAQNLYCGLCGRKMKRKKVWKKDKSHFYYQYVCPSKDNASHACSNKSISSKKLKQMICNKIRKEIETVRENRKKALQYEATLKYQMWYNFRKTRIGELEDLYADANAALKIAYEKYQDNFYSQYDFKRIQQHLHARKNCLKAEILELQAELDEYKKHYSSESDRIRVLLPFDGANELLPEMCNQIERYELKGKILRIKFCLL